MILRNINFLRLLVLLLMVFGTANLYAQTTDSDGDGVIDSNDRCPNTPTGTAVNAYGCPITSATCDYTTPSITFNATTAPAGSVTKYILANAADGKIVQISDTPTFTGLTGTQTYMALAYSYNNDGSLVNLAVNNYLNQVSAVCADWSNALVVKVCVPPASTCDYTTSTISLGATTAPTGATTKYVLVDQSGLISQISNTSTFSGLSGTNVYNAYAISYTTAVSNLAVGNTLASVTGSCFDWSNPLSIKVCVNNVLCPTPICVQISVVKIK